jgi:L-ascorbate metabolism protein UlaG (beta-lactamase superfamily)
MGVAFTLVGGPTVVIGYAGLQLLVDPAFDSPRSYEARPGVTLTKLSEPALQPDELPPIDAVLLSHDQHFDNFDQAGRAFAVEAPLVLTTPSGAERMGPPAQALPAWAPTTVGSEVTVTAVPAQHGPDEGHHLMGEVIGFHLAAPGEPAVYVSGDNASLRVVEEIAERLGSPEIALLNAGAARAPGVDGPLTLTSEDAARAARALGTRHVVPAHFEGWAHFSEDAAGLQHAFAEAGLSDRLTLLRPGESAELD